MRRRDQQHLGPMRGKRAPAHRAGDDAREIEHLDAGKGTIGHGQGLR